MKPENRFIPSSRHLLVLFLFSALFMAPAFLLGAGGGDLHCQSLWVRLFSAQFWQGEIYPRWLQDMYAGNGSPVFFYYPPLAYFVAACFYFLSPLDPFGYYPIVASAFLAVLIASVTFYVWIKEETNSSETALIGSLLYIAAPAHITQNFYYLMLFSSVWAYAWLPLLMMFAKRIAIGKPFSVPGFAFALALLVMSNLPMTLIFGPLAVAYSALYFCRPNLIRQASRLALAVVLGFGLSALYLIPSLLYIGFANINFEWTRAQLVRKPYLTRLDDISDWLYVLYAVGAALLTFIYFNAAPKKPERWFFLAVSLAALFMMLPVSKPIWDFLPLLHAIQMSERFFTVLSLSLALFAAVTLPRLRSLAYGLIVLYACIMAAVAWNTRTTVEAFHKTDPARYNAYTHNVEQYATYLTTPDLMKLYGSPEGLKEVMAHHDQVEVLSGDARIEVQEWHPREIVFHYQAAQPSTLRVRQFAFPGWSTFQGDKELDINRDEHTGRIQFDVPAGAGVIRLKLTELLPETGGRLISIMSAALLFLCLLVEMRQKRRFAQYGSNNT